jgi:hypothetical protein
MMVRVQCETVGEWPIEDQESITITSRYGGTVVLLWCYSGVTTVLQWCYSGVTVVLQWCYSGATVVKGPTTAQEHASR